MRILPTLIIVVLLVVGAAFMLSEKIGHSTGIQISVKDLMSSTSPAAVINARQ